MTHSGNIHNIREALDASAIVAITDPRGVIQYANAKFCEISQYSQEELIGQDHRLLNSGHHPKEFFQEMWATILRGDKWDGEICNRAKDGSHYWVHTTIMPFVDEAGHIQEFVSIRWDITARKTAEVQLRETTNNLQNLLDSSFEGLVIYDLSGRLRWWNVSAETLLPKSSVLNTTATIEELLGPQYKIFVEDVQTLSLPQETSTRLIETTTKPYYFQNHRAYLISFRDITERTRVESQILQQERLASVGILASGLAHEIGTPLGIMRGRAEMMVQQPGAAIIIQQIDRITHLIQNLLKLARGSQTEKPQSVHILSLLADMEDFILFEMRKQGVSWSTEVAEDFEMTGVPNSLFQVILNLLINALHAIEERKKTEPLLIGKISIRAERTTSAALLHIEDNGCGMDEKTLQNLFTPFFTTKEVGKGTGLGLATSYRLLHSWGGFLSVKSHKNQGTIFTIHTPTRK
ncbi:MAG: ATP-binding protein [Bdellovibrio sp.]